MIMYITAGTFNIMLKQADSLGISESDTLHALQLDTSIFNNPTIGLEMGFRFPSSILGTIINVYQNCRTLKEVFEKITPLCSRSKYSMPIF